MVMKDVVSWRDKLLTVSIPPPGILLQVEFPCVHKPTVISNLSYSEKRKYQKQV